jgi:ankyrin repeat protein
MHNMIDLQFHEYDNQIRDGSYPLHIALSNSANLDVITILLKAASSVNDIHSYGGDGKKVVLQLTNKFGQIPMDIAKDKRYDEALITSLKP